MQKEIGFLQKKGTCFTFWVLLRCGDHFQKVEHTVLLKIVSPRHANETHILKQVYDDSSNKTIN